MNNWKLLVSGASDGPGNMALDEALFESAVNDASAPSVFRLYTWTSPCMTIGYFQKNSEFAAAKLPVTRRMTGGLAVKHGADVSYGMITREADWPEVYDQEATYKKLHSAIKRALELAGVKTEFYSDRPPRGANSICVQTFFPYDLQVSGRKVLGSCQRRRGKALLLEGSIHIKELPALEEFGKCAARGFQETLGITLEPSKPEPAEAELAAGALRLKYSSDDWNKKY